jgi:hypothetical protein
VVLQEGGNAAAAASILNETMSLVLRIQEEMELGAPAGRTTRGGTPETTGSVELQEWVHESHSTKRCDLKATL